MGAKLLCTRLQVMLDGGLGAMERANLEPLSFFLQRIETGLTGSGVPDVHFVCRGVSGWIENKAQRAAGCVPLRPEQIGWQDRYRRAGGRVLVAVRLVHGGGVRKGPAVDELWLLRGDPRDMRRIGLVVEAPWVLGRWAGGPTSWRWDAFAELLIR